ncbi:Protein of unknown function [Collimonas sp. OK307]|uniref:DUF2971 domain-containing protein n=1 Tax=Collimonas sp. OK307 TaxID=1801620 RepID=UPI0008E22FA8|nr:DUF2971 domain-containing protein [Collimonas sp. OK307]SFH85471.1 Protein of unknown function [Collimonas sp. OK307]
MRLYYYTAKQWGMKSLWEKRLKIAQYADLNDPFELLPFTQTDKEARAHTKMVVNVLSQEHGVLCFSKSWRTTLMWAHYGDKHTGMCLGFDIEDGPHLTKIDYVSRRLPSPIDFSKPLGGVDEPMLAKCLNVKHSGWKYEKEYRLRAALQERRDSNYYNSFNNGMALREVIIGARSTLSIVDVAEAIGTEPEANVEIWTARAAHGTFNMCANRELPRKTISGVEPALNKQRQLAEALRQYGKE